METRPDSASSGHHRTAAGANNRSELGHWEGDLIEGRGRRSYLLSLRERRSRFGLVLPLRNKEKATVTAALIRQLRIFRRSFRSLTLDNGGEFAGHQQVAAALGRPGSIFFARSYRASDKGSVEEFNGRVRRDHPKGTDFNQLNAADLTRLHERLDRPPLRVLGGRSPIDFLDQLLGRHPRGQPSGAGRMLRILPCTPP